MADLSTVERALVGRVAAVLWPGAPYAAGAKVASAAAGLTVKVFRGWPVADDLDADLIAGRAQVAIHAEQGMARNTTRHLNEWRQLTEVAPTLTATASGATVTFAGTGGVGQVAGVTVGAGTVPDAYSYRLVTGDTPALVAGAFADMIDGASAVGAVLTVPGAAGARVVADSQSVKLLRMQQQGFRISMWCPSPGARDTLAALVDAGLTDLRRIALADGTVASMTYRGTFVFDPAQKARIWRRDLAFMLEYATTVVEAQPTVLFAGGVIGVSFGVAGVPVVADALAQFGPSDPPPTELFADEDIDHLHTDAAGSLLAPE